MYTVDSRDTLTSLPEVPESCTGAPLPMITASEGRLHLAYHARCAPPGPEGRPAAAADELMRDGPVALVDFVSPRAHFFGPPNDEALEGHPLASRGLRPYSAFEVHESSWLRLLERMNAVHPHHRPARAGEWRHFVFTFHDSTFECIAGGLEFSLHEDDIVDVLRRVVGAA